MTQMKTSSYEMKVAIIANGKPQSRRVASKLFNAFRDDPDFYLTKKNPDVVISIGGDGMLLSAFHMYEKELARVRFVGIHTGHLGFYTDYLDSEVNQLIETLRKDNGAKISFTSIALNEAAIKRNEKTMAADVCLNDVLFESFRGDGLSVSTPTGSTAYNKSLGGAVLHPTIEALQLTEIASLNNRVYRTLGSPLIVPKHEKITVYPTRMGSYTLSVDNKTYTNRNVKKIEFSIDQRKISFVASASHTSFWERVRESFIGDMEE